MRPPTFAEYTHEFHYPPPPKKWLICTTNNRKTLLLQDIRIPSLGRSGFEPSSSLLPSSVKYSDTKVYAP